MPMHGFALFTLLGLIAQEPAVEDIVKRSLEREMLSLQGLDQYIWQERGAVRRFDKSGQVTKTETTLREVLRIEGSRYQRTLEENGKPLSADKARKEQEKMDREIAKRRSESAGDRAKRLREEEKRKAEDRKVREDVARAYAWKLEGVEEVAGRACWKVNATPKPGFKGQSDLAKFLPKMRGSIWVDQSSYEWLRLEAETLDTLRFGGFLASLEPGAVMQMRQRSVNGEFFHPEWIRVRANPRLLVAKFRVEVEVAYLNFRKFSAESKIVASEAVVPR